VRKPGGREIYRIGAGATFDGTEKLQDPCIGLSGAWARGQPNQSVHLAAVSVSEMSGVALLMTRYSYLLIILLISAQVDNFWDVAPFSRSFPVADDDEYLPSPLRARQETPGPDDTLWLPGTRRPPENLSPDRTWMPCEYKVLNPGCRFLLYIFMSLQR
jgi:hypothetical protein